MKWPLDQYDSAVKVMLELWEWIETEWNNITKKDFLRLIEGMGN